MRYLALLRGINVGGNNIIKKDDLKAVFEAAGCSDVVTYIQSGNIVFSVDGITRGELHTRIDRVLSEKMEQPIPFVLFTEQAYRDLMRDAPKKWNSDSSKKYNALFLLNHATKAEIASLLPNPLSEYESVHVSSGVIFWTCDKEYYTKTGYAKLLAKSPLYKIVTIRNGNTTLKLLELLHKNHYS